MGFPCKYTNSQCGTCADYGGHAVPEDSAGGRFSETDARDAITGLLLLNKEGADRGAGYKEDKEEGYRQGIPEAQSWKDAGVEE